VPVSKQHSHPPPRQQKVSRSQAHDAREQLAAGGLSHDERRKLKAVAGARDAAASRRRGEFKRIVIIAAGAIAAMAIVGAALGLVPAIAAASRQGTPGTFTVGSQPCMTRGCYWSGTFQSQGGATVGHVTYDGTLPAGAGAGSGVPALYPAGGSHVVYPPHGSDAWITDLVLVVLVGAIVGFGLWISPVGLGRRETAGAVV
jgi:hypothetical protein